MHGRYLSAFNLLSKKNVSNKMILVAIGQIAIILLLIIILLSEFDDFGP